MYDNQYRSGFINLLVCGMLWCLKAASCGIITEPESIVGLDGTRLVLKCQIDGGQHNWEVKYPGDTTKVISTNANVMADYTDIYAVEGGPQSYNLVLKSATLSRAGTYTCVDVSDNDRSSAEIIILESRPECSTNATGVEDTFTLISGEYINYTCYVNYQGNWRPTMELYNQEMKLPIQDESVDTINPKRLQYSISQQVSDTDDQSNVVLLFNFVQKVQAGPHMTVPYIWDGPTMTVMYPPRNITLTHCKAFNYCKVITADWSGKVYRGDKIIATATANPQIDYFKWTIGSRVLEGQNQNELRIRDNGVFFMKCTVNNTMQDGIVGTARKVRAITVTDEPKCGQCVVKTTSGMSKGGVAGVAIGCLILGAALPTLALIYYIRKNQ